MLAQNVIKIGIRSIKWWKTNVIGVVGGKQASNRQYGKVRSVSLKRGTTWFKDFIY